MLKKIGEAAKKASLCLAKLNTKQKNNILINIVDYLQQHSNIILFANAKDMVIAKAKHMSTIIQERLLLTTERLNTIINDVRRISQLIDPVGRILDGRWLDNGLNIYRQSIPLGVIGVIYEARPNVTIDVVSLCLKTSNAVILRGGKETSQTNKAIVKIIHRALQDNDIPKTAVQFIDNPDKKIVKKLLKMDRYIDMLIPRGGAELHKLCREQSTIPIISGGIGVCHIYVDQYIDFDKALPLIINAKVQSPSACNSLETLLVHKNIADKFLPLLAQKMIEQNVILHASHHAMSYLNGSPATVVEMIKTNLRGEWLSLDVNIEVVNNIDAAINHIREYGTAHSDAILTKSIQEANYFVKNIDSAVVYVNASTRFTDGGQFGLGAEVAVSTQKLHARGPMGLDALTTYKWIVYGDNLIRY
ncbi:MAG: glutamate-5-semialdehyde dehydrogenase [Arsenophonus sp. ET-KM2-MAG3]